jgi:cytochrome P450
VFNPKRFIDSNNCFNKTGFPAFIPFSSGTRMCIGDKFAMNVLFLSLTNLLQATDGYKILLADKQNADFEQKNYGFFTEPKNYEILINKE